jgi:hypothetical protein
MGLFDFFRKKRLESKPRRDQLDELMRENPSFKKELETVYGEKLTDPLERLKIMTLIKQRVLSESGCDSDEIPNGTGRFGYDLTNPIPVRMPPGMYDYLGRLSVPSGKPIRANRVGSISSPQSNDQGSTVDIVEIFNFEDELIATLYFSTYHQKTSRKSPDGFRLS